MTEKTDSLLFHESSENQFGSMDRAFLLLRIFVLIGGFGWLYFAPLPNEQKFQILIVFLFFSFYTASLYVAIFYNIQGIRTFYLVGLLFDLIFIFLLLMLTGGGASTFFIGFYILVALHSFYYGLHVGVLVSSVSSVIYLISYVNSGYPIHWTDFVLRLIFLFVLSISAGFLSEKMKLDKERIDQLNQELNASLGDLKKTQKKLIETAKFTALGRMTSDVAHEIRNPLVTIGGFARRCNAKIDPALPEKKYAQVIVDEVGRLEKILRDLLTFTKGPPRAFIKIKLVSFLEKCILMVRDEIQEKEIQVVNEFSEDLTFLYGDQEQLEQVFLNILLNAIQSMQRGRLLTVRAYLTGGHGETFVTIEVQDTGTGIPEEIRERIFNPFFTTKIGGEGTGLGLSVSRRIVEEHHGRIELESKIGEGSTFRVSIPQNLKQPSGMTSREEVNG